MQGQHEAGVLQGLRSEKVGDNVPGLLSRKFNQVTILRKPYLIYIYIDTHHGNLIEVP